MMTANRCSALEPLTSPLSPFAKKIGPAHLTSAERDIGLGNFPSGRYAISRTHAERRYAARTSNSDRDAVEFGDREPLEFLPRVVVVLVAEQADGRGLAEPHPPLGVRPPMNAREVASLTDVRGELVNFALDREVGWIEMGVLQRQPVFARHNDGGVNKVVEGGGSVKGGIEDRGACARHRRVATWVGWVLRACFGISLRKEIGAFVCKYVRQRRGIQYVGVEGVAPLLLPGLGPVDQAAILVGSQGAMYEPLGIPGGFESARRGFADQTQEERHAKGSEWGLLGVAATGCPVGVAGVERSAVFKEKNSGIIERHEQAGVRVGMNIGCQVATVADGAGFLVDLVNLRWGLSALVGKPFLLGGEVIVAGESDADQSIHGIGTITELLEQELRDIRPDQIIGGKSPEQSLRRYGAVRPRSLELL